MANIVERFEGDNIKTQHGGKGSVFFSVPGFSFGLTAEYSKTLVNKGKTRDVNGKPNEKIGENIAAIEKAQTAQKVAAVSRAAGLCGK